MHNMKLESDGILISITPFNERDAIAHIFTYKHGVLTGMLRGANIVKQNKPLAGQIGHTTWNARLDSQLGVFHWEYEKNLVVSLMQNPTTLSYINSAFSLIQALLPERESYPKLYEATVILLQNINQSPTERYLDWEIKLLQELGYALDLSHCSGCNTYESLEYLSPRTGRAVCTKCAAPYIPKLYKLPLNLGITLRFLDNICTQQGTQIPLMRKILK